MSSGGATLPYNPVLILGPGDSNLTGSSAAADQAAAVAAYVPNPKILTLNASTQFVTYTPGTVTGMNNWSNTPQVGAEIGFINRFTAAYPNNTLYIIKLGRAGGYQTRGPSTGSFTGSTATNVLTKSSGTDPALNEILVGDGTVPLGAIVNSVKTASTEWFLSRVQPVAGGSTSYSATVASQTLTRYLATQSLSPDEGTLWSGLAGSTTNGYRARAVNGLALVPGTKKIVLVTHQLGTNDKAAIAGVYSRYRNDAEVLIAAMKLNYGLTSDIPIVMHRVRGTDTGSLSVRSDQAAIDAADAQVQLMDMDTYPVWDTTHFTIAGLTSIGEALFDNYAAF